MIIITAKMHSAKTGETTVLGVAEIYNDGRGTKTFGTYKCELFTKSKKIKSGRIVGFHRNKSVWWLLFHFLRMFLWEDGKEGELYRNSIPQSFKRLK